MKEEIVPKGLHKHRLENDFNSTEIAFHEQWVSENDGSDCLHGLFNVYCKHDDPEVIGEIFGSYFKRPLGEVTERDRLVVSTFFQWLGSPVGMSLLQVALERDGMRIVTKK